MEQQGLIAIGLGALLAVACSGGPTESKDGAVEVSSVLLPLPPDVHDNCAPIDVLGSMSAVVTAAGVAIADSPFVSRSQSEYLVLDLEAPTTLSVRESRQGTPIGNDVDISVDSVLVGAFARQGADAETIEALLAVDHPVVVVTFTEIATKQVRPVVRAAGRIAPDGRIELVGPCGELLQPALDESAALFGTTTTADWLVRVADPESAEAVAVLDAFMG